MPAPNPQPASRAKMLRLDSEACAILETLPTGNASQGKFVARLILEFVARRDEQARLGRRESLREECG
jgi:hypothetical protein